MIHHLRAAGVSVVVDSRGAKVPILVHWGADLGALTQNELAAFADAGVPAVAPSSIDVPFRHRLLPSIVDGWSGMPAVTMLGVDVMPRHVGTSQIAGVIESMSSLAESMIATRIELTPTGVLLVEHSVRNTGAAALHLVSADVVLPIPARAREMLDFTGKWTRERQPQRLTPGLGTWLRESRHGRGGHDDALLMVAGTPGFGFRHGEVWSTHVAWSGDTRQWVERSPLGSTSLGAGERFESIALAPGAEYRTPVVVATWSADGLDGLSDRLHPWVRSWAPAPRPRPLTLNTWEAVYFDHSLEGLTPLVEAAASVGFERFVLDDGWFRGRTDDRRALGDWTVDPVHWPEGLSPLIDRVNDSGMEFGLWVEPEMVSLDSDLARAHPDWLLTDPASVTWRWQHVLDVSRDDVRAYLFERLDALLAEYPIRFLKWDHNRDLLVENTHEQVLGLYRLIDELRLAHPDVEIESCASGGGRIDLGMLRRVDRFWTSDSNDPLERQRIQRHTGILVPPEYLGSHVGDARAHTTGRVSTMAFRLATALFSHAGAEADLTKLPAADLEALRTWARVYKDHRALLHTGTVVRADAAEDAVLIHGVVSADRREALFSYAVMDAFDSALPPAMACPGIDPALSYRVEIVDLGATPTTIQDAAPPWTAGGVTLPGTAIRAGALAMPLLAPGNAVVVSLRAEQITVPPTGETS